MSAQGMVCRVVFFEAALEPVEHGDGVNHNQPDFVRDEFWQGFDGVFLFLKTGGPKEDEFVEVFFVVGEDLFESLDGKASFGIDVDDPFAAFCGGGCGKECEVGFARACGTKEGGDAVCFKSAAKEFVEKVDSCWLAAKMHTGDSRKEPL